MTNECGPILLPRAVHDSTAASGRGGQRPVSRRVVLKYAVTAPVLLSLGTVAATVDAQMASAADIRLIDFTERRSRRIRSNRGAMTGHWSMCPSRARAQTSSSKPVTREYADALRVAGLHVVSCYQYGKPGWPDPSDFTRGYDGGVADAQTALRLHAAAGGGDSAPIFFSVDEDIDLNTWKSVAAEWFRGINSVLGVARTGIYGHFRACGWAIEDGVIGPSTTAGYWWVWQTSAWSHGEREPRAVLYQAVVNTPSSPGPLLGGTHVDVDDVLAADFGQWDLDR